MDVADFNLSRSGGRRNAARDITLPYRDKPCKRVRDDTSIQIRSEGERDRRREERVIIDNYLTA